jgi:aldose 1-epimerase
MFSYFNISKSKTIEKTEVTLSTNQHLPVDDTLIPTGSVEPYPNIEPLTPFVLGQHQPDIDHCFIMDPYDEEPDTIPTDTRGRPIRIHASFYHPDSKTHLEVLSTEPAFQFYTGKYIDVPAIKDPNGVILVPSREARAGFCVEPSRYVNAVNKPEWKSMVTVKRGEKFGSRVIYRAWKGK